jgi:hypothetical protein
MLLWTQSYDDPVMNEEMNWVSHVDLYNCSLVAAGAVNTKLYFESNTWEWGFYINSNIRIKIKVIHLFVTQNEMLQTGKLLHTDLYKLHHLAVISLNLPSTNLYQLGGNSVTHS